VVNAAGYTAVDAAETDEDRAYTVNAEAVRILASEYRSIDAQFIHVSTDYVFAGDAAIPYEIGDTTRPKTAYGRTKLAGERFALKSGATVVRTAWVYGGPGSNFVDTMLQLARPRPTVTSSMIKSDRRPGFRV
jgi:dTDP-4-dehydrorhamnose reductase